MSGARRIVALVVLAIALLVPATGASAAEAPAWRFDITAVPTNLKPGDVPYEIEKHIPSYFMLATNVGTAATKGPVTITDTLPPGLELEAISSYSQGSESGGSCSTEGKTVTCVFSGSLPASGLILEELSFAVDGTGTILHEGDTVVDDAVLSGGGAPAVTAENRSTVSSATPSFGFLPGLEGFNITPYADDGTSETLAGGHPHVLSVNLGVTSRRSGDAPDGVEGGLHDVVVDLPRGLIVSPTATPRRCLEVELEALACPPNTQIGIANVLSSLVGPTVFQQPIYNMEPAPGKASNFGFVAVFYPVHIEGTLRPGDYTEMAETRGIPNLQEKPILGVQLLFWGDPSAPSFDWARAGLFSSECFEHCPVPKQDVPALTMPTSCTEIPAGEAQAFSYDHLQGPPATTGDVMRDANGNEIGVTGCAGVQFAPTLKARPTTTVAESPSGLEVDLEVPQTNSLSQRGTANLRTAEVTLPEGLVINPASANGLAACSSAQVGIDDATAVPNGDPVACPAASRIGSLEVETSLVDHPLPGSIYVATPYDNPFDSLLAIYAVVEDPRAGLLIKLPGHVVADPSTGRLVATFDENPQLPFSHFKLNFFGGARAILRTPANCGTYSTKSVLTPWSAPDSGPPAVFTDEYSINTPPSGGNCQSPANETTVDAGVVKPVAGIYTPFVLHLHRGDGTQQFSSFSMKFPPGLTGRLAGATECSDASLSAAAQKTGAEEQASPSCPASSQLGSVTAGAGAGPSPFYAHGTVYLSGPYKGAPLSIAVVTPAVAGPFDLGTIVVRAALRIDQNTGQITAESDPIPSILKGIPLDLRSVDLEIDRPEFTRTGTSCDASAFQGSVDSVLGQAVPILDRYQLGECLALPFKPKLGIRLFGSPKRAKNPALRARVALPTNGANISEASVALPHSEFLDQSHIGTVCTRVQFAQGDGNGSACPAASVYGEAAATSPLVGYQLEGPVFLRSSSHTLPDLVAALHGPASQPIKIDVVGRISSFDGGIRASFEGVPDLPVSSFVLNMKGGKKGLLQNSTNICKAVNRASALFVGQNGKAIELEPAVRDNHCRKGRPKHKKKRHPHRHPHRHHRAR